MADALFVLATLVPASIALLFVRGCAALIEGDRDER